MEIKEYSKKFIHYYTTYIPEIIRGVLADNKIESFADLGCGDGPLLYALKKSGDLNKINKIVAVDVSEDRIANVKLLDGRIKTIVSDVSTLDFLKNDNFDFMVSSQVIEHLKNDEIFISQVKKKLKENGLFYLSTVYKKWYGWYFYRCNGKWALDPTHLREYTVDSQLLGIMKNNGMEVLINKKTLYWFPVADFFLKRLGAKQSVYNNKLINTLRKIKLPIFGYYNWELLMRKSNG